MGLVNPKIGAVSNRRGRGLFLTRTVNAAHTRRMAESAGSVQGPHLVVTDIEAAHAELTARGAEVSEVFHVADGARTSGPDPARGIYNSFVSFTDPDGNGRLVQEVNRR